MKYILLILAVAILSPLSAMAHSGGTASDGGHYCWTNCEYYGVQYGVRHFHTPVVSVPTIPLSYEEKEELLKDSKRYKKVKNGYKLYDILICKDGYIKKDGKCEEKKVKKLKSTKESQSMRSPIKNERIRLVNALKEEKFETLEDLTDKKWKKYKKDILKYAPESEILKYAPNSFIKENKLGS